MSSNSSQPHEATRPAAIEDVLRVLDVVAEGDLSARLDPQRAESDLETQLLYRALNRTLEAMERSERRMEAYQSLLEESQRELEEQLTTINEQRSAIRALRTPVMELWDRVVCIPVLGTVDAERGAEMVQTVLATVADRKARCVIADITGIETLDTAAADQIIAMSRAVRLLGASFILSGASPSVANTIVQMGVRLDDVRTERSLRDALRSYLSRQA
jgi:rsbT co-antagonist protein RsbR